MQGETLAQLVRVIAHDFGNMIAAMGMSLSLAKLKYDRQHEGVRQAIEDAELACERATKLAKQLVALSRGDGEKHVFGLHELLATVVNACAKDASAPIEVDATGPLPVESVEAQVALMLYALLMTAVYGNADGRRVPVHADLWEDPATGDRFARVSVQFGNTFRSPTFGLEQAAPLVQAAGGRIQREQTATAHCVRLLLPSVE